MSKNENYKAGQDDGRRGFMSSSSNEQYRHGYMAGKQEYDYWNDKSLYPDLGGNNEYADSGQSGSFSDDRISGGTVFGVTFFWILMMAPLSLFLTWENAFYQVLFWGGVGVIVLLFGLWLYGAAEEERRGKGK